MNPLTVLGALGTVQQLRASVSGWSHRISLASIFGAACLVLGLVALIFLAMTLFLALSDVLSPVAAASAVTLLFVILAAIAGFLARHAIMRGRGGTRTRAAVPAPAAPLAAQDPMLSAVNALGAVDSRTLLALGAGLIGGLLATQLRARAARPDIRQAAE
jgi:hypothetical protein